MNEEVLRNRGDLGKVSERTKTLRVEIGLTKEDAINIMKRCRTLEEVIFEYDAFVKTDDEAKEYLSKWVYLERE